MRRNIVVIAALLFIGNYTVAQKQFSGWLADFNTIKLNKKLSVHSDFQLRSSDEIDHVQTLLLRGGLNYHAGKRFVISSGYAFIHNRGVVTGISGYANEHRIWEQVIFNHPITFGPGTRARQASMQHRLRVEQRFIPRLVVDNGSLRSEETRFASRVRYFFRNVTPLVPWNRNGAAPFFAIQDEVFLNLGNKSVVNGKTFDQNRLYLALGYRFSKKFDLEAGYLNQYVNGRNDAFTNNHIVQLATYVRL